MNLLRCASFAAAALLASPFTALAHPGHDDPEITWDLKHLVDHPLATLACLAALLGAAWLIRQSLLRSERENDQSFREASERNEK